MRHKKPPEQPAENKTSAIGSVRRWISSVKQQSIWRTWYRFRKSKLSIVGLVLSIAVVFVAVFAPFIAPYPSSAGFYINFSEKNEPPTWQHPFGTDGYGRDILSRCIFGFRYSLMIAGLILLIAVPIGSMMGLIAGFYAGAWEDTVIMRLTDIFLALPPLILAMAVCSVLAPSLFNAMLAISVAWWPWYCRLLYGQVSSIRNESFVQASELGGASLFHMIFKEILPNMLSVILTKASLDVGGVILVGAMLSFVGLGAQAPTPDLGTMISESWQYLPHIWCPTVFPALCIILVILAFNLLGDGIRDMYATEVV